VRGSSSEEGRLKPVLGDVLGVANRPVLRELGLESPSVPSSAASFFKIEQRCERDFAVGGSGPQAFRNPASQSRYSDGDTLEKAIIVLEACGIVNPQK
jgi:hypothetical protein